MLKRLSLFVLGLFSLLSLLAGCVDVAPPPPAPEISTAEPQKLLLIGIESSLQSIQPVLEDHFSQLEQDDQISLLVPGSYSDLQAQLLAGELDGIFVYQKPATGSLWTMPVALDSISVIAHQDLVLTSLTRSDLQQIFAGDVQDWQAWSGENQPILRFVLSDKSGVQALFNERVMENRPFDVSAVVPLDQTAMIDLVSQTAGGVGFVPTSSTASDSPVQIVPVDNFFPQFNSVRSQQYPLTIPIFLATQGEPEGQMRNLVAWLQSVEGRQSLAKNFVQIGN